MPIPFDNFEDSVDPVILGRGFSYFNSGRVDEPEELYEGLFEATVWGSMAYEVCIQLKEEQITQYSCTCPYDYGPICKHVVSLIYYMHEEMGTGLKNGSQKLQKVKRFLNKLTSYYQKYRMMI